MLALWRPVQLGRCPGSGVDVYVSNSELASASSPLDSVPAVLAKRSRLQNALHFSYAALAQMRGNSLTMKETRLLLRRRLRCSSAWPIRDYTPARTRRASVQSMARCESCSYAALLVHTLPAPLPLATSATRNDRAATARAVQQAGRGTCTVRARPEGISHTVTRVCQSCS